MHNTYGGLYKKLNVVQKACEKAKEFMGRLWFPHASFGYLKAWQYLSDYNS